MGRWCLRWRRAFPLWRSHGGAFLHDPASGSARHFLRHRSGKTRSLPVKLRSGTILLGELFLPLRGPGFSRCPEGPISSDRERRVADFSSRPAFLAERRAAAFVRPTPPPSSAGRTGAGPAHRRCPSRSSASPRPPSRGNASSEALSPKSVPITVMSGLRSPGHHVTTRWVARRARQYKSRRAIPGRGPRSSGAAGRPAKRDRSRERA